MTDSSYPQHFELTENDKLMLMRHIKRIAELYDEYTNDLQGISSSHREEGPNPLFGRTLNGLFLEFYYGGPYRLWTPWGAWLFAAAVPEATDVPAFMSRITVWAYVSGNSYQDGSPISPIYGIQAIESQALPVAIYADQERPHNPAAIREEWKQFYVSC